MAAEKIKRRRPRKLQIADKTYSVVSRSKEWGAKHKAFGRCHYDKQVIEYAREQDVIELVDTIIHEVLHAAIQEYNITVKSEEKIVTALANSVTDILVKNPHLLSWIQAKIENSK